MALVLIVDDSSFQRRMIRNILAGDGHETIEAGDGGAGIEMAAAHSPDCMLMDLLMPGVSGLEALETLHDQGNSIPVIILTSDIQDSVRQQCLDLGARVFLNKPPKAEELLGAIRTVLGS